MLLLLGGRDIPTGVPTVEMPYDQNRVIQSSDSSWTESSVFILIS